MTLLQVRDLTVTFHQEKRSFDALKSVSLDVAPGEVVGLVGESGCGKTTLARAVLGLQAMTEGAVFFRGEDIAGHNKVQRAAYCRKVQMVFQDPFSSLNPRMTIGAILEEVLKVHTRKTREERRVGARELLEAVELEAAMLSRYPHEFSGGQRQRIVIARALALQPEMLLADEPVSALDVSVQGRILDLLRKLHEKRGLAMVFISHDLAVVQAICSRVYVMYLGRIVESGPVNDVFRAPAHPYTKALLSAVPRLPDDAHQGPRIILRGDVPTAIDVIPGCAFHPRCPQVHADCSQNTPALENLPGKRQVSCLHHYEDSLQNLQ